MDQSSAARALRSTPTNATQVLGNHLLLDMVFRRLPIDSVMRLRLVNKMWNRSAIPVLKKYGHLMILEADFDESELTQLERAVEIVDCIQYSTAFPFTKLNIQLSPFTKGHIWNVVLRNVASFLTHLMVTGPGESPAFDYPSLPEDIRLPQLKELSIYLYETDEEPLFLSQIIAVSPKLKTMEITDAGRRVLQQLTRLPDLKLEKLTLDYDNHHFEDVSNFLMSQRDNLLELSIYAPNLRSLLEVDSLSYTFPKVKALFHLHKTGFPPENGNEGSIVQRIEYAKKFPNLETLRLETVTKRSYSSFFSAENSVPTTSVTTLRLGHLTTIGCQEAMVKYIPTMFPNVTTLEVTSGFKNLVELMAKLNHLKTVTLTSSKHLGSSVDPILGGLDVKDWHKQKQLSVQPFGLVKDLGQRLDQPPHSAWHKIAILNLNYGWDSPFPVSEATCLLVLLQMRNLKEVHFKGRLPKENEISATVMKEMEARFQVFFPMTD